MADYTESDLTAIRAAKATLLAGSRVDRFSHGNVSIDYGKVTMEELDRQEALVLASIQTAAMRPRFVLISTSKGL